MTRRPITALLASILVVACLSACGSTSYDPSAAATGSDEQATKLVNRLFSDVKRKDKVDLERFLTPDWRLQRATGQSLSKSEFIGGLPDLYSYSISTMRATQYENTMVAAYAAKTDLVVNGVRYPGTPAPYISSFIKVDNEWHLLSHGNFNKPK